MAISILPRHASELAGADGVPLVSVDSISKSWPSRSTTAHHILVVLPEPLSADDVALAMVWQLVKIVAALALVRPVADAVSGRKVKRIIPATTTIVFTIITPFR